MERVEDKSICRTERRDGHAATRAITEADRPASVPKKPCEGGGSPWSTGRAGTAGAGSRPPSGSAAAADTVAFWEGNLDFDGLAEDIAIEARLALRLGEELNERMAVFLAQPDPLGIMTSVPRVGAILGAQILGRLGDLNRFRTLAGVRSFQPARPLAGRLGHLGSPWWSHRTWGCMPA